MLSLREYQQRLTAAIMESGAPPPSWITPEALTVHQQTVFGTWTRALTLTFPSLHACAPLEFQRLADEFVRRHPPETPCLVEYGSRFPDFLEALRDSTIPQLLLDIARFDLALEQAARRPFGPERVICRIAPNTELRLSASVSCFITHYPVDLIRGAVESGSPHPLAGLDLAPTRRYFAIWRGPNGPSAKQLSEGAASFLAALLEQDWPRELKGAAAGIQPDAELLHAIRNEILMASFVRTTRLSETGIPV